LNTSAVRKEEKTQLNTANEAFRLAEVHQVSPTPMAYEVWHTYITGKNTELNNHLDNLTKSGGIISEYDLEQIHSKFVLQTGQNLTDHDVVAGKLKTETDDILDIIQTYLVSGEHFSGALDESITTLNENPTPDQVLQAVKSLVVENSAMRDNSADLMENLNNSKNQMLEMQSSLNESRQNEMRDALTNMYNRRYFDRVLAESITNARETETPMCLIMSDIDNFKKLNDQYGHLIGDEVLKFVGSLLMNNVKGQDTPARYGGEEFVIILPNTEAANAKALIENIRGQLESARLSLSKSQQSIGKVTASFGIAQIQESEGPMELIQRADANMYKAKNAGKNCVVC
jgi:diguanylate cyclase